MSKASPGLLRSDRATVTRWGVFGRNREQDRLADGDAVARTIREQIRQELNLTASASVL